VQISARLQAVIAEPIAMNGLRLYLTASIGFFAPRRATERIAEFCLDAAEQALEDARANGRGSIRAYAKHNKRKRITRSGLVEDVQTALEGNQILPWFQPQLSTDTGDVSGVEALARWHHPVHGIILPGAFLPAVSGAGLTSRLGQVVLRHALSAMAEWDAEGLDVPSVGVNFSSEDLSDPKLVDKIRWELDCFNLAPERLTVEILETVVAANAKDIITRNISEIAKLGCKIDLDDFGTGHASIANVRRFFVNRIKIDRTFVSKVDSDREQQEMLTAILELANRLNIDTLAEGVETREEHALLSQLGCKHVQGYHIAKAMPAVEMTQWLAQHRMTQSALPVLPKKSGT
jgi:EAL domain-containing protein (putative c-di-GMP-specific phosphodiesterase class I)